MFAVIKLAPLFNTNVPFGVELPQVYVPKSIVLPVKIFKVGYVEPEASVVVTFDNNCNVLVVVVPLPTFITIPFDTVPDECVNDCAPLAFNKLIVAIPAETVVPRVNAPPLTTMFP